MPSKIEAEGSKYQAQLRATLKAGKLTEAQAQALVNDAKSGDFTEVKAFYLASFVQRDADKFEPAAKATLQCFVDGSMGKIAQAEAELGTSPAAGEPTLAKGDKSVDFKKTSGALVDGKMSSDDPVQGALGDCYFVSSMAAVAGSRPDLLKKAIHDNGNGTFTVTFWQHADMAKAPEPVKITVDAKIPEKSGAPEYVGARDGKELWPEIFEKAYATWKGGYEKIQGGMGANALSALTGATPGFFPVTADMKPDDVWKKLQSACNGGCVVADSTGFGDSVKGVISDHTYTVLGTEEKDGQKLVKLRNPWGETEPGNDGKDDGIFTLPVEDFMKAYAMVEYVKP